MTETPVELAVDEAAASLTRTIEALNAKVAGWDPRRHTRTGLDGLLAAVEALTGQLDRLRRPAQRPNVSAPRYLAPRILDAIATLKANQEEE